jgi:hypothetical protein
MFKLHLTFDRHNARLKINYCLLPDPPHFSLLSTFNATLFDLHNCIYIDCDIQF